MVNSDSASRVALGALWSSYSTAEYRVAIDPNQLASAAWQVILSQSYGAPPQALDVLHDIAKAHNVVTPYSSMIILVNDRQKEQLEKSSQNEDSIERESRSGKERLSSPASPSAVPEPHEWLLIIVSCILLLGLWRRRETFGHAAFG